MDLKAWPDPLIGVEIHDYVIRRCIGRGGMGAVYYAEQPRLKRSSVVKVILPMLAADPVLQDRFLREAETMALVKDRHFVDVMHCGVLPTGQPYLMMEYLQGRTLSSVIGDSRMMLQLAGMIVMQVCRALHLLHDKGIVHRDVKPDNIMLVEDRDVRVLAKLLDFGLARNRNDDSKRASRTLADTAMGTLAYMPPEQMVSATNVTPAADLYAVNSVLFECLTGRPPFDVPTDPDMPQWKMLATMYERKSARNGIPILPSNLDLPKGLIAFVRSQLSPVASTRIQTAKQYAIALADLIPAKEPFMPSGNAILKEVASFFRSASTIDDATQRKAPEETGPTPGNPLILAAAGLSLEPRPQASPKLESGGVEPNALQTATAPERPKAIERPTDAPTPAGQAASGLRPSELVAAQRPTLTTFDVSPGVASRSTPVQPVGPIPPMLSTFGASAGVITPQRAETAPRSRRALFGTAFGVAALSAVVVVAASRFGGNRESSHAPTMQPATAGTTALPTNSTASPPASSPPASSPPASSPPASSPPASLPPTRPTSSPPTRPPSSPPASSPPTRPTSSPPASSPPTRPTSSPPSGSHPSVSHVRSSHDSAPAASEQSPVGRSTNPGSAGDADDMMR